MDIAMLTRLGVVALVASTLTVATVDFAQEQGRRETAATAPQSRSAEADRRDGPANDIETPRYLCPTARAEDHRRRGVDPSSQDAPQRVPPPASQPPVETPAPKAPPESAQSNAEPAEAR